MDVNIHISVFDGGDMSGQAPERGVRTVVVIGGGVAGLAAAVRLSCAPGGPRVLLLESRDRLGGLLHTVIRDGFLIEEAADSISLGQPSGMRNLCQRIGLYDQLVPARVCGHHAMILHGDRLRPLPSGFLLMAPTRLWPLMTTRILTLAGKLRLAVEPFVAVNRLIDDESVAQFVCRRLGRQAYERLVQPLAEAIYGGDPARLSMAATMPRIVEMERSHGSLFRASKIERRGQRKVLGTEGKHGSQSESRAPEQGMSSLVAALARQMPSDSIWLNSPAKQLVRRNDGRWGIVVARDHSKILTADGVIIAVPANSSAHILTGVHRQLAGELDHIEYSPRIHVTLGYRAEQLARRPDALGFFLPRTARRSMRSLTLASEKFPGRAPPGSIQLRVTLADRNGQSMDQLSDDELGHVAATEVKLLLGIQGSPHFHYVVRHRQAVPQYTVGHLARMKRIDGFLTECRGLALAGAAYRGVGVPQCIHSGEQAAEAMLQYLSQIGNDMSRSREPSTGSTE
jgi:oxygen-dependent protoporphyrinogen oxidase